MVVYVGDDLRGIDALENPLSTTPFLICLFRCPPIMYVVLVASSPLNGAGWRCVYTIVLHNVEVFDARDSFHSTCDHCQPRTHYPALGWPQ